MTFEEMKAIAEEKASAYGQKISKAYKLGNAYVFETEEEIIGSFPLVVDTEGNQSALWAYLNEHDLTMDDMVEIEM